jgi:6-phosphogluconolactonase (cycloisomerase 2 family)
VGGAVGELTNLRSTGADSTNLEYAQTLTMAPDGKHVYAGGQRSDTLVYWDRDAATGALTNQVNVYDKTNLEDVRGATVSPDGKFVFAMGATSNSLVYWNRDANTGDLTNQVNLIDSTNLKGGSRVTVSPDGKNLYATGMVQSGTEPRLRVWDRDPVTGELTNLITFDESNLDNARNVIVSPDGRNVYVAAFLGQAIVYFDRDCRAINVTRFGFRIGV